MSSCDTNSCYAHCVEWKTQKAKAPQLHSVQQSKMLDPTFYFFVSFVVVATFAVLLAWASRRPKNFPPGIYKSHFILFYINYFWLFFYDQIYTIIYLFVKK